MDLAFFFYTVGLIGLALVACSVSVVVHLMTARKDCFLAAVGFSLYALDLSLIFLTSTPGQNMITAARFSIRSRTRCRAWRSDSPFWRAFGCGRLSERGPR